MADLKSWRLDFEALIPDRKQQIDPPGYDFAIAKDPVRIRYYHTSASIPLLIQPSSHRWGSQAQSNPVTGIRLRASSRWDSKLLSGFPWRLSLEEYVLLYYEGVQRVLPASLCN